ncbi:hypothetical protein CPB85DRAFT_1255509 [Mucidula mucida]|nr:hypothetical protein CPB85DRAFT_1255509 [Mucidula mucida]
MSTRRMHSTCQTCRPLWLACILVYVKGYGRSPSFSKRNFVWTLLPNSVMYLDESGLWYGNGGHDTIMACTHEDTCDTNDRMGEAPFFERSQGYEPNTSGEYAVFPFRVPIGTINFISVYGSKGAHDVLYTHCQLWDGKDTGKSPQLLGPGQRKMPTPVGTVTQFDFSGDSMIHGRDKKYERWNKAGGLQFSLSSAIQDLPLVFEFSAHNGTRLATRHVNYARHRNLITLKDEVGAPTGNHSEKSAHVVLGDTARRCSITGAAHDIIHRLFETVIPDNGNLRGSACNVKKLLDNCGTMSKESEYYTELECEIRMRIPISTQLDHGIPMNRNSQSSLQLMHAGSKLQRVSIEVEIGSESEEKLYSPERFFQLGKRWALSDEVNYAVVKELKYERRG